MAGVSLITGGKGISDRSETDFYPTPTASTESLFDNYGFKDGIVVYEPAAGKGHIGKVVKDKLPNCTLYMSDLYDYGNKDVVTDVDFLKEDIEQEIDWVITNPPYSKDLLMPFVEKSLKIANKGVAMFLKITFLESTARYNFFNTTRCLKEVLLFSNRQPMYKNGEYSKASNAIMYAWFIWDKSYKGLPTINWIDNSKRVKELKDKNIY